MGIVKEAGEFSLESRGLTVSEPNCTGGGSVTVDYEGTATGYGFIASTVTFTVREAGAKEGTTTANTIAWLENGDSLGAAGNGVFTTSGVNTWRVRATSFVTDGTVLITDGEVSLAERSYKGKIYVWE
jgi:hypothetical protein